MGITSSYRSQDKFQYANNVKNLPLVYCDKIPPIKTKPQMANKLSKSTIYDKLINLISVMVSKPEEFNLSVCPKCILVAGSEYPALNKDKITPEQDEYLYTIPTKFYIIHRC